MICIHYDTMNVFDMLLYLQIHLHTFYNTQDDPVGRNSMIQRLSMGGVGKTYKKNQPTGFS